MKKIGIVFILAFILVSNVIVQAQTLNKKSTKAKKSKRFEPPPEPAGGIKIVGEPIVVTGNPPPTAPKFPLDAWKETTFAQGNFVVAFPTKPNESSKTNTKNGVETSSKEYKVLTIDGTYSVTIIELQNRREESKEEVQKRLRSLLKELESGPYKWLGGKEIEVNGYPGVEFKYTYSNFPEVSWNRFIAVHDRMYRIVAETIVRKPELKEPQIFLDSFKLLPRDLMEMESSVPQPPPPAVTPAPGFAGLEKTLVVRITGGVSSGTALKKFYPPYPPEASIVRASGAVQVAITISEKGNVIEANAVSGHELLREAAVKAAREWTFKPTESSGVPVKIQSILTFHFTFQ